MERKLVFSTAVLLAALLVAISPVFSADSFPEKFSLSPKAASTQNDYSKTLSGKSILFEGTRVHLSTPEWTFSGTFNRLSGEFSGTYSVDWSYPQADTFRKARSSGEFYGKISPGSETATINFRNSVVRTISPSSGKAGPASEWGPEPLICSLAEIEGLPDSGFVFSGISGQVEVLIPKADGTYDEEDWTFAKLDMDLPAGTRIKTSERSGVILSFADMTTFEMKPESEIVLSKIGENEPGPLKLLAGDLLGNVKKVLKGEQLVEGSQAVCGIKGTIFSVGETGSKTTLRVIEGTVAFSLKGTGPGLGVSVSSGEEISAAGGVLGKKGAFDSESERKSWSSLNSSGKILLPLIGALALAIAGAGAFLLLGRKRKAGKKQAPERTKGK